MLTEEIERVIEESSRKLHQISIPPVRRWLLEYVDYKDREDIVLQKTLRECESYPPRVKLLKTLREDGTWPIPVRRREEEDAGPGPPYGWTYVTMLRNLYMLYEYCTPAEEGYMEAAIEKILDWQHGDGYIRGPELDMIPRPHYNGLALGVLLRFRTEDDPRIRRLIDWLLAMQRPDGGWIVPYHQDVRYAPPYKGMRLSDFLELVRRGEVGAYRAEDFYDVPSCVWSTVGALRGLSWCKSLLSDTKVRRGGTYVLDHFFKRNYHSNYYRAEKIWTTLKFPTYFGSGLTALDLLVYLGVGRDNGRIEKPLRWLLNARTKDGFWHRSERPHPIDDQWITVTALMILRHHTRT